jgi:hypothetical protein
MKKSIVNGAPGILNLGVKDESVRPYTRTPEELPQHLPKFIIYAQTGPCVLDAQPEKLLVGNERQTMFGEETFNVPGKYFTHQVLYANIVNTYGNAAMYVRVLGKNHGPKPTIRIWADVLPTQVDLYQRNDDNSIKLNPLGEPTIVGQATGYRVKYVVDHITSDANRNVFGTLDPMDGDQTDAVSGVQSTRYPILELRHSFYGEDGNLCGIRLWSQHLENTGSLPTRMINKERALPFNFGIIRKNTKTGNSKFKTTLFNEQYITVTLKQDVVDPSTTQRLYMGERVVKSYQNLSDTRYPEQFSEFGEMKIYQNNIDLLLGLFHAAEIPFLTSSSDFTADPSEKYMFNLITGVDLNNNPYHSMVFVDDGNSVRFSENTNVFAAGGADGEMDLANFAASVGEYMSRYADLTDELMDDAYHVESHFYDSGFPLDVKYDLIKFISERKDTFVVLTPFEFGERVLTASEEFSVATALLSRLQMYPESTYWGTPVYRGLIQGCTGRIRNSGYDGHVSSSYEIASKSAKYMGAANGRFKGEFRFEGYPGHIVDNMYDLSIRWVPDTVRVRNWDTGLNFVARFDRKQFYFPAFKTVYTEDTSILTSYLTACIFLTANKSLAKCQRVFSGRSDLNNAQFSKAVNDWLAEDLNGKFDNRVVIVPKAHFTSLDERRNYSWTVPLEIGAPGMKTVMTGYAVARRIEDMLAENQ